MKKCLIFGAGEYDTAPVQKNDGDLLIAADGGYRQCLALNLTPDILLGDFDSLGYVPENANLILPEEKDITDTYAAVEQGLKRGYTHFELYGVLGGRIDHSLANISILAKLSQQGISAVLLGRGYKITALTNGKMTLKGKVGNTVSVFSFTPESRGVTLQGLKYPLDNAILEYTFPLGVSNAFVKDTASVDVRDGTVLIIEYT